MKNNNLLILILLIVAVIGYVLAWGQYRVNVELETELLKDKIDRISELNDSLLVIRDDKNITMEELLKSKARLDALINASNSGDADTMTLDDAMKIINNLK